MHHFLFPHKLGHYPVDFSEVTAGEATSPTYWPLITTVKLTGSSLYGDGMYVSSRRISFSFFAFRASAGKSTSTDWVASCPGSSRSGPDVANLIVGPGPVSSSLIGCPWASGGWLFPP